MNKFRSEASFGELQRSSKAYKKAVNKLKSKERKKQIRKLRNAKTSDPKYYWSVINRKNKGDTSIQGPNLSQFFESFKRLAGTPHVGVIEQEDVCSICKRFRKLSN